LILLASLAGIYLLVEMVIDREKAPEPVFPGFDGGTAARISIQGRERPTVMEKTDGIWLVTSEDSLPADPDAVDSILDELTTMLKENVVSSNPAKRGVYQVDTSGIEVEVEDASGDVLASLVVGKVGPDYQSTYIRGASSDQVLLQEGYLIPVFERGDRTWQDQKVFSVEPSRIDWIRIERPSGELALERGEGETWHRAGGDTTTLDPQRMGRLIRSLAYLRADGFAGRMPLAGSGLEEPDSSVWFGGEDLEEKGLLVGNSAGDDQIYMRRAGEDVIFRVPAFKAAEIFPDPALLEPQSGGRE
jgi:hypothetical protein